MVQGICAVKGILGYAGYLPAYRISRDAIAAAWGSRSPGGQKRTIRFDEDSLTMAATAAQDCLATLPEREIAGLVFASTTAPYAERLNAGVLAAICDLPPDCTTADFGGSLRAGATALRLALESQATSRGSATLVCAADTREAAPGSAEEMSFGDAAAAIAVGEGDVLAEVVATAGCYDDFFDAVRRDRDPRVVSYASKFSVERGYQRNLTAVIRRVLQQAGLDPGQVHRLVVNSPDRKSHIQLSKKLGFREDRVQDIGWQDIGLTGCSMPLLLLASALEEAEPGEWILLAAYGDGADALLLRTTEKIRAYRPRVRLDCQRKQSIDSGSYTLYRAAREYLRGQEDTLEISNVFYAKEESQNVRLHGVSCRHCGTRQLPQASICVGCQKGDGLEEVALARTGKIFTYAVDSLYPSAFPPTVMAVVDLDGGGRLYCEVVDVEPSRVSIGMPVELAIRRLKEGGGLHHYFWKCRPRRA